MRTEAAKGNQGQVQGESKGTANLKGGEGLGAGASIAGT